MRLLKNVFKMAMSFLAATIVYSCTDKPGTWDIIVATIPDDADAVVSISPELYKESPADTSAMSLAAQLKPVENFLTKDIDHIIYVCHQHLSFFTWPVTDPSAAKQITSGWENVEISGDNSTMAKSFSNSVAICDGRQLWLIPSYTNIKESVERLNSVVSAAMSENDSDLYGLKGSPLATKIITTKPQGIMELWINGGDDTHIFTGNVTESQDNYILDINRHDASGITIPLSKDLIPVDKALAADYTSQAPLSAIIGMKKDAFVRFLSSTVAPNLSLTQRLAVSAISSIMNKAQGTIAISAKPGHDTTLDIKATVMFADGGANEAAIKTKSLTSGVKLPIVCSADSNDKLLHMELSVDAPRIAQSLGTIKNAGTPQDFNDVTAALHLSISQNPYFSQLKPLAGAEISLRATSRKATITIPRLEPSALTSAILSLFYQ